ncbi:lipocalin family protein [Mesonia maritima]|uniref:Lipocalin-like domain-containing protein n=1 Tax=Mesonia maritima TaxID=1793873 RepID=A0ABU1K8H6_9FLAO|nr:lipocalin family protein [Mesonia maritima]MDR6301611.1 hypothetical protein [Mesonia maritima]
MKKILFLCFTVVLISACGTTKIERQAERTFKGNWTLNSITYPNSNGFVDVTLFDHAKANCFRNSDWNFVSNNNQGQYNLTGADCPSGTQNFTWAVQEVNAETGLYDFTLKPVDEGENARKLRTGYRLSLKSLTENNMVWEQTVSFEGNPFIIRMSFTKK